MQKAVHFFLAEAREDMKQILTITSHRTQAVAISRCLADLSERYALCGMADNAVTGMSLIEATAPDLVIMSAKMVFWNAENLINHLISQGLCPCFLLLCDEPLEIGDAAKSKVAAVLPETTFTKQQLLDALQLAEAKIDTEGRNENRPVNSAVQHSLEVAELLMGLAPLQTQEAQQKYGRLEVGRKNCWLLLGAPASPIEYNYLSDLSRLEELMQALTILLRPLGACEICVFRETNLCILLEEQSGTVPDWDLWLSQINDHLEAVNLQSLLFEISDTPLPLEQWHASCRELMRLREMRFFFSPLYLQPRTKEQYRKFISHDQIHSGLSGLSLALQTCEPSRIQSALTELETMVCSSLSRDVYSLVSSQMVLQYSNLCYSLQLDPQQQPEYSFQFRQFSSVSDFFGAYWKKVANVLEQVKKNASPNATVAKVCRYIQQHLSEDLNLELLAKQVFVSPSYLSRLFKKEMNIALSAHINQLRVQKAIQLLNTNYGISELAAMVGFDNPKYFSQVFKKIVGKTPQEYRKFLQEGNQS